MWLNKQKCRIFEYTFIKLNTTHPNSCYGDTQITKLNENETIVG